MAKSTPKNDRALRFYNEVLGLKHLHYGIWDDDDELSLTNLKKAQQRYEDMVVSAIPAGVSSILDVGCGTGELSKRLKQAGYDVEGLSPDVNQKKLYPDKTGGCPFHFCRFEEFEPAKQYDCIIMSESGQYIPLQRLFAVAAQTLKPDGVLINIDYFVLEHAQGIMAKSGHRLNAYLEQSANHRFSVLTDEDITWQTTKTLDLSKLLVERSRTAFDIATEKFRLRHPVVTRFAGWLARNKLRSIDEQMQLLDSEQFAANKSYRLFVFQLDTATESAPAPA